MAATALADLELPELTYPDPELRGDRFHEVMLQLREAGWAAGSNIGWLFVLDHEAANFFLRSHSVEFPSKTVAAAFGITEGPLADAIAENLISIEGADHRRLRNLVNPAFKPGEANRRRDSMRAHLAELWAGPEAAGECEFATEVARHYPSRMIAELVGAPVDDALRLYDWAVWFQRQFDPEAILAEREGIEAAITEFHGYAGGLIEARRSDPQDDLISLLLGATYEGDRLSDNECLNLVMNVIAGGVDTTAAQLSHAVRLFARYPDQWQLLREDPELVDAAVDEVLRFEPITPFTARMTFEDVEFRDVVVPAQTVVMISTHAANRDPALTEAPDVFDIAADRGKVKLMTFGAGIHNCLGMNLAKAELQEAFRFLAERVESWELAGEPVFESVAGVYGLERLPVRFTAATRPD